MWSPCVILLPFLLPLSLSFFAFPSSSSLSLSLPTPTSWIPDYPSPAPPPRHRQRPPGVVLPERPCARLVTGVEGSGQAYRHGAGRARAHDANGCGGGCRPPPLPPRWMRGSAAPRRRNWPPSCSGSGGRWPSAAPPVRPPRRVSSPSALGQRRIAPRCSSCRFPWRRRGP